MIIFVDLNEGCLHPCHEAAISRLLHEISDIYIKGRHYIIMSRRCSSWIKDNIQLGRKEQTVINALYSEYTTSKSMLDKAATFLEVLDIDSALCAKISGYSIGINRFIEKEYYEKPHLLVENKLADGDFLSVILYNLARRNGLGRLSYEIVHGGGADMPALYKRTLKDRAVSICIADSDKSHPAAGESDKCKKIRKLKDRHGVGITDFFQLPCHEAENLIPWSTFQGLTLSVGERQSIDVLQKIEAEEEASGIPLDDRLRVYFNFKDGWDATKVDTAKHRDLAKFMDVKLQMVGLSADTYALEGFGDKLTRRVAEEGKAAAALCRDIFGCSYWTKMFSPPLVKLCSILVGSEPRPAM